MITGLRTREPLGFTKFIEMIQQAAAKKGSVLQAIAEAGLSLRQMTRSSMRNIWISASAIAGISILRGKPGTRTKTAS